MNFPTITISKAIQDSCPDIRLGCMLCRVNVEHTDPSLRDFIQNQLEVIQRNQTLEDIHSLPPLLDTRIAYKALGKDPSRYRPSAEALLRRVVQGKGLYEVNNVVDCLNLISVQTGFSIGGYDAEKINGAIELGRGEEEEPYAAIGRGTLNIAGLPVLRDKNGAFGSPTSDSQRTMVTPDTAWFLAIIFDFGNPGLLEKAMLALEELLTSHADGKDFKKVYG